MLFTVLRESLMSNSRDIAVKSLETGERKVLIERGSDGRYVASGHLVFAREAALWAAPFDRAALAVTGPEFPILEGVSQALNTNNGLRETGTAQFTVSPSGSLAYIGGSVFPNDEREVVWVDRQGKEESIGIEPARYHAVRLSPDGTSVALDLKGQIWTYDLIRGGSSIQTSEGSNGTPIWSPNGSTLVFGSDRSGSRNLFSKAVDGLGGAEQLSPDKQYQTVGSWSPDGTKLAFIQVKPGSQNNYDIWVMSLEGSSSVEPILATNSYEMSPEFSPNGRWLAYAAGESGRVEVYVQRYPEKGGRQQISVNGGMSPVWSAKGDELFYLTGLGDRLKKYWAVDITISGDTLKPGIPVLLFEKECVATTPHRSYDVARDGQRFLMVSRNQAEEQAMRRDYFGRKVQIVLNWSEELRHLAASDQ